MKIDKSKIYLKSELMYLKLLENHPELICYYDEFLSNINNYKNDNEVLKIFGLYSFIDVRPLNNSTDKHEKTKEYYFCGIDLTDRNSYIFISETDYKFVSLLDNYIMSDDKSSLIYNEYIISKGVNKNEIE